MEDNITPTNHHIYLNALKGANGIGVINFRGHINGMEIQILFWTMGDRVVSYNLELFTILNYQLNHH